MSNTAYVSMDDKGRGPSVSSAAKDPFYVVKDKVQTAVRKLRIDYDGWKDLLQSSDTSTDPEFKSKNTAVRNGVKFIKENLNALKGAIAMVETNRPKFPDIDDDELQKRNQFVADTRAMLEQVVGHLNSEQTKKKLADDKSKAAAGPRPMSLEERQRDQEEKGFVEERSSAQAQVVAEQDVVLGDMEQVLKRLGDIAGTMDTELDAQNKALGDWNEEMTETQDNMDAVIAKIQKLLGTSDKGKLCCILVLFLIVVILFFVLIYA